MQEPFSELSQYELDPGFAEFLPLEFGVERNVVFLGRRPADPAAPLIAGCLNPGDGALRDELSVKLRRPVTLVQLNPYEVRHALQRIYGLEVQLDEPGHERVGAQRRISFAPGQSPRDILADTLAAAFRESASDIHIETSPAPTARRSPCASWIGAASSSTSTTSRCRARSGSAGSR